MNNLYKKIEQLCAEKGISRAQLCKDVGISPGNLTDLKMGRKKSFSAKNLSRLAEYFSVPMGYLLEEETSPSSLDAEESKQTQSDEDSTMDGNNPELKVTANEMAELADVFNTLRDRSEMKLLFKSAKTASPEQIRAIAAMLDSFKKE